MHEGQKQFYSYIMERVKEDARVKVDAMLKENFKKQEEGTFHAEALHQFETDILVYLKSEHVEEVKQLMKQFGPQELS